MLYNLVLVSSEQRCESAVCRLHPLPHGSPLPAHPIYLGHLGAPSWAPRAIEQVPTSCFTHGNAHTSTLMSQFIPCPSPSVQFCSLCLHPYSCPANKSICIIFLDSTCMLIWCFFSSEFSLCMTDSKSTPISTSDQFHFF